MKETNKKYKLSLEYKKEIKTYLSATFLTGRVYISTAEKSKGVHGVHGLGHPDNNFGLKIVQRRNKQVGKYDAETDELLETFDSTILASTKLKIPFSSLGNYIRFGHIIDGFIFRLKDSTL
jgi:hypothetical protein